MDEQQENFNERLIPINEGLDSFERDQIGKRNYDSWYEEKIVDKLNEST